MAIFEALDRLGGMLRVGIPDYQLPPDLLDREIAHVLRTGIEVNPAAVGARLHPGEPPGRRVQTHSGRSATSGHGRGIPGERDLDNAMNAVDWLREAETSAPASAPAEGWW